MNTRIPIDYRDAQKTMAALLDPALGKAGQIYYELLNTDLERKGIENLGSLAMLNVHLLGSRQALPSFQLLGTAPTDLPFMTIPPQ